MEQVQSSMFLIHVLFVPSFTQKSYSNCCVSLSENRLRMRAGPFKALERVSVLVSAGRPRPITCAQSQRGGAGVSGFPSLPVLCQLQASEQKGVRLREWSVSVGDPAPTPRIPAWATPTLPAGPRAAGGFYPARMRRLGEMAALPDLPASASLDLLLRRRPAPHALQASPRRKLAPGNGPGAASAAAPGGGARPGGGEEPRGGGPGAPGTMQRRPGLRRGGVRSLLLPKAWLGLSPRHPGLGRAPWGTGRANPVGGGLGGGGRTAGVLGVANASREENGAWCKSLLFPYGLLRSSPPPTPPPTNLSLPPPLQALPAPGFQQLLGTARPFSASWCSSPSGCTEFLCPLVPVYFHLVFSNSPSTPSSMTEIHFFSCVLYIFYTSVLVSPSWITGLLPFFEQ